MRRVHEINFEYTCAHQRTYDGKSYKDEKQEVD